MDISTVIGAVLGLIAVVLGIAIGGDLAPYMDITSYLIVFGGALGAVMVAHPKERSFKIFQLLGSTIKQPKLDYGDSIRTLVSFSEKARREGLLSLEEDLEGLTDQFMKKGIQLVVDGTDPDLLKAMLEIEVDLLDSELNGETKVLESAGAFAPAFGMIGTVIGLIAMLGALNNPDALGPAMAKALVTTFLGAVTANILFLPMAEKSATRKEYVLMHKRMILEGIASIQAGDNPRLLEEKLKSFLVPADRKEYEGKSGRSG